jgi:outer membrane protein assembly factor BamB
MRLALRLVLAGLALPAAAAGTAAGAPLTLTGWPALAPPGSVHAGPTPGGAVVIGSAGDDLVVQANRQDGRRLWRTARMPGCGNCDTSAQPVQRQPDGTYGPIGFTGDDFWSVDRTGAIARGCSGVVLPDGTCIAVGLSFEIGIQGSVLRAVRSDGIKAWEYAEPEFSFIPDFDVPPVVAMDDAGTVYTAYGQGTVPSTRQMARARLIAVDAATGVLRWRVQEGLSVAAALADGVLARAPEGLVALNADGTRRWTVAAPTGERFGFPRNVLVDRQRERVYVQIGSEHTARVMAIDARTGAVLWRTAPRDLARLLAVTNAGPVLVATQREGLPALRAIGPEGKGRWQLPTLTRVVDAAGLSDGTVALTQGGRSRVGLLTRIDPSRREPAPRHPRVSLSRATVPGGSAYGEGDPGGTVLRVATPHATRLQIRLLTAAGAPVDRRARPLVLRAPAGRSFVGVLPCHEVRPSRVQVEVTLGKRVTRLPVRVVGRPTPPG